MDTKCFYLCLALCGVILTMLTMFFNYSLKLDARTVKLEKKNGKELHEIEKLNEKVENLEKKLKNHENLSSLSKKKSIPKL